MPPIWDIEFDVFLNNYDLLDTKFTLKSGFSTKESKIQIIRSLLENKGKDSISSKIVKKKIENIKFIFWSVNNYFKDLKCFMDLTA